MNALTTWHGPVNVTHHQLLIEGGTTTPHPNKISNALVAAWRDAAVILTGIHSGVIEVTVQLHSGPPPLRVNEWEEVAETSLESSTGRLGLVGLSSATPRGFGNLAWEGAGAYRIRVHARGRDTQVDGVALNPVETFLIQLWRAPAQPDAIHKQSDAFGRGWRTSAADQPDETPPAAPNRKPRSKGEAMDDWARPQLRRE